VLPGARRDFATATLPDGRSQSRGAVPVQPRSTVVVQSFRFA